MNESRTKLITKYISAQQQQRKTSQTTNWQWFQIKAL